MSEQSKLAEEIDTLRTLRDEIRLQIHLARSEAREQWESAEKHWQRLEGRARVVADESKASAQRVEDAASLVVDEIRESYRAIKALL